MRTRFFTGRLAVALLAGLLTSPVLAAPVSAETKGKPNATADKIRKDLDQTITLDVTDQPLHLAVNMLREQAKLNLVLDRLTIQQMGMDPDQVPVNLKLKDVKVRSALRTLLTPLNL